MKPTLYYLDFEDGTVYKGGDSIYKSKWLDIPKDKFVKKLRYRLPAGDFLCLEGYSFYNHFSEFTQSINVRSESPIFAGTYLMGQKGGLVVVYRIQNRNISVYVAEKGKELHDRPTSGWISGKTSAVKE